MSNFLGIDFRCYLKFPDFYKIDFINFKISISSKLSKQHFIMNYFEFCHEDKGSKQKIGVSIVNRSLY